MQDVAAVNGFAYGVVGADVHAFDTGEPLYLLAGWRPEPAAEVAWLRQMPSRMLNGRRAVVPFTGRTAELGELRSWRDGRPRLGVRWLHGPGGQGKSRLAAQLASESAAAGWKVVAAFHGPDADRPDPGSHDLTLVGSRGLLLIVDYADRWTIGNLTWLFANRLLHRPGVPTRVLLIGRGSDAWPVVRRILEAHRADMSEQELPELPAGADRAAMFTAARDRFAAVYGRPAANRPAPAGLLGLTLAVHMAALVAVDADVLGERPPETMEALTIYLLNREQLHWARLLPDSPPPRMVQAVFVAALTGAMDRTAGTALLRTLEVDNPEQAVADHKVCYPPAGASVLEPLYPDRLTEDFLALSLPGHGVGYPALDWAPAAAERVMEAGHLTRAITFLASAADRWPHVGRTVLYPFLTARPALAVEAGGAALNTLAAGRHADIGMLAGIEPLLPMTQHADLDAAAATLSNRIIQQRLALATGPAERADLLAAHSRRLMYAGRRATALTAASEAVRHYRGAADVKATDPGAYAISLANLLNNLSTRLVDLGRHEEAYAAVAEAVEIQRGRDATNPYTMGMALSSLSRMQFGLGRLDEALASAEEGVALLRESDHLPDLARALNNFTHRLGGVGRRDESRVAAEEAVAVRRRLVARDPQPNLPDLAMALDTLGNAQSDTGRFEPAWRSAEESVRIYRHLAEINPGAHRPGLARAIGNLGLRLFRLDRSDEALVQMYDALHCYRELAEELPGTFLTDVARTLHNLAIVLGTRNRAREALPAQAESIDIRRRLAETNPDGELPALAESLTIYAMIALEAGEGARAQAAATEAITVLGPYAQRHPRSFGPALGRAYLIMVEVLERTGHRREAKDLRRRLPG